MDPIFGRDVSYYLFELPFAGGQTPTIPLAGPASVVPRTRLTHVGGDFIGWDATGRTAYYSIGHTFFRWDVALAARSEDKLRELVKELGDDRALAKRCDVTEFGDQEALVAATIERFGRIDAAFANAGFGGGRSFLAGEPERMRDMILTNVYGAGLTVRATLPALKDGRGHLLLTGSVAGHRVLEHGGDTRRDVDRVLEVLHRIEDGRRWRGHGEARRPRVGRSERVGAEPDHAPHRQQLGEMRGLGTEEPPRHVRLRAGEEQDVVTIEIASGLDLDRRPGDASVATLAQLHRRSTGAVVDEGVAVEGGDRLRITLRFECRHRRRCRGAGVDPAGQHDDHRR